MRDELIREAHLLKREEFVAQYPYVFFAHGFEGDGTGRAASLHSPKANLISATQIVPLSPSGALPDVLPEGILPVVKSERNPYRDRVSIGRASICDMVLAAPAVSKLHAHFLMEPGGGWSVRDARSTNGTFVNGQRLQEEVRVPIRPGDRLRFAYCDGRFFDAAGLHALLTTAPAAR